MYEHKLHDCWGEVVDSKFLLYSSLCNCLCSIKWNACAACSTAGAYLPTSYLHCKHELMAKKDNQCQCQHARAGIETALHAFGNTNVFVLKNRMTNASGDKMQSAFLPALK
jgi:hypothetical protein